MNKKLVALAVAGAFALPLAAEAQTGAQVTLYGRANMDLEFVKASGAGAADGSTTTVTRVSSNSSRFGLRGTEALGGGLTAFFQVENSVNWDGNGAGNANTIANRETFVGLQGSYGQIWLGRSLSPYDDTTPIWASGPYNYNTGLFNNSSLWANNSNAIGGEAIAGYDDRYSNSIRWNSPTWSGFTVEVQLASKENTAHSWGFFPGVFYNNGPIQAGFTYARHDKIRCYNAAGTSYAPCAASSGITGLAAKDDAFTLAGSYDFGVARVALMYEHLKYETPTGDLKRDMWGISGTIPMGGGLWYVYYGRAGDGKGGASDSETRINSLVHGSDSASSNFEIGYRYDLSKRTSVNAGYVMIRNDARANYTFNVNGYAVAPGGDPQGFVLGIIHNF
ncbi:MAG TPA: porin [Casimicrobiaceae bacterium]|jgi:predicted porin|nr:porin [Casimicrobiaceae bacterium]